MVRSYLISAEISRNAKLDCERYLISSPKCSPELEGFIALPSGHEKDPLMGGQTT